MALYQMVKIGSCSFGSTKHFKLDTLEQNENILEFSMILQNDTSTEAKTMVVLDFLVIHRGKRSCENYVILDFMRFYQIDICIHRRCENRVILDFPTKWS